MKLSDWDLVELIRDFFSVYRRLQLIFEDFEAGSPCYEEVAELVGDSDESVLFRLKERCHAMFRREDASEIGIRREVLFDLAMGSLFHETRALREILYQQEIYAPRVSRMIRDADEEEAALLHEFERIQSAEAQRTVEALHETRSLLEQTRNQLRVLMRDFGGNGLVARDLVFHPDRVREVFGIEVEELLSEIHGEAIEGYRVACHSCLDSAFFDDAVECLENSERLGVESPDLRRLHHYAVGMSDFSQARYGKSLESLGRWVEAGPDRSELAYLGFALSAISRVRQLVKPEEEASSIQQSADLVRVLQQLIDAHAA